MTRLTIESNETRRVVVGWDTPMNTFFMQEFIHQTNTVRDLIGAKHDECTDIAKFRELVTKKGVAISDIELQTLSRDRSKALPLSALQKEVNQLFRDWNGVK